MKKTKERIKDKARELFNVQGMSDTSLRNIAQALGISQGNLNYHYKVKQDLVDFRIDGLNTLRFDEVSKEENNLVTKISIEL